MQFKTSITHHLVKSEDLNHHGTLYAGRTMEWFVEAGFIAAACWLQPANIVCHTIHSVTFTSPVQRGEIVELISRIVYTGTSSLTAHISCTANGRAVLSGFILFIHVDMDGTKMPHGLVLEPSNEEERLLQEQASQLKKSNS